jgi:hypothetical protein
MALTQSDLREVLDYDPATGIFRWKVALSFRTRVGQIAGSNHGNGYLEIGINGESYYANRLAWLYMTGEWPKGHVDHRDLNRRNNRWDNLRDATHGQNVQNSGPRRHNASGYKGVTLLKSKKWHARIMANRKLHILGNFATKSEAVTAYNEAAKRLHGEFYRSDR